MIIPNKHSGYGEGGRLTSTRKVYVGGGGGGSSGTQTVEQTNVPSWLRPQFEDMMGRGIALSQKDYELYPGERTADFTQMQQDAFDRAGQQGVAGQIGQATGLAGLASLQGLNAQFDPYATGQFTGQTAQQYMNPFMQNVVDIQKREAQRQSQIGQTQDQARAVQAGAFGGSRQAILQAERERNLGQQLGDIQATGSQAAFQAAQDQFNREQQTREQSRQFGAGFGMEGLRTALSGAGQLGQLGQQQFGQEMDITGLQRDIGGQQQAQQQREYDEQYGDFQAQRDFPYQQLGFLSDMLRGTGSSTRSIYQPAQPGFAQTAVGLGTAAAGFGGFGRAKGGEVKRYANGGITGLLDDQQLAQTAQNADQGPMMQLAAAEEAQQRDMIRSAVPADMPRETDMTEQELLAALQQAIREGNQTKARVIAELIEERKMPESGIAAIASDDIGDMPEGGLIGMAYGGEVQRFYGGGMPLSPMDLTEEEFQQRLLEEQEMQSGRGLMAAPTAEQMAAAHQANPRMMAGLPALKQIDDTPPADGSVSGGGVMAPAELMAMAREFGIDPQAAADRQTKLAGQKAEARGRRVDEQEANLEDFIRSRGVYGKEQEAEARQEIEGLAGKKLDAKSFALIQAGLAILSADPSRGAFSAIGEGAAKGLMGYKGDLEKLDEKREKINGRLDRILELRRLETTADGKDRLALKNERSMLEELALDDHREIAGNLDKSKEGLGTTLFNAHIRQREAELNRKARRNDELAMQRMSLNALNSRRILLQGQLKTAQTAFDEAEIDRINAALTDLDRELQTRGGMGSASGAGGGTLSQADQDLINRYSTAP
jgi:hypothetical protein